MKIYCVIYFSSCMGYGLERRIIRGYEAKPFAHEFMVSIQYEGLHSCGGTLYKQDTVITAAHCNEVDVHRFDVLVHRHDFRKSDHEEKGSRFKVREFVPHPEYSLNGVRNDIAVVRLYRKESELTGVILDDGKLSDKAGTKLTVLGWGLTEDGEYPNTLQETNLPILDIEYCKDRYAVLKYRLEDAIAFCAGYAKAKSDTCNADSGGPAFVEPVSNQIILVGVISWGMGCAQDGFPGIYTKVSNYIPWLLKTV